MNTSTETHTLIWQGISLRIVWNPRWIELPHLDFASAHLEVHSDERQQLPITETGYCSRFLQREEVEEYGGPVGYVKAWLDEAGQSRAWKAHVEASRQGSLF